MAKTIFLVLAAALLVVAAVTQDLSDGENIDEVPVRVVRQACTPGTTFRRACNTCRCTSTGVAACTQRACIG